LVGYCQKEQYICDEIGNGAQMIVDCWFYPWIWDCIEKKY
jgi:hypothetical protein